MPMASCATGRRWIAIAALLIAAGGAVPDAAHAVDWPKRPVKIIAPFAPGGTADALGRIVADHLSEMLHQPFYVENRAGASGLIGSAAVMAAEPDGYTLVVSGIASHIIARPRSRRRPMTACAISPTSRISAGRRSVSWCIRRWA